MKLLIIGGTGFIGKNLKLYFEDQSKIDVFSPTRKELNLFDDKACLEYVKNLKPDLVTHSAVDITSVENTLKIFLNIYNAKEFFGHMIQIGSGAEYDKRAYVPKISEGQFRKSVPIDTYGVAKFCISDLLETHTDSKFTNLRLFGIFGGYEDYSRRFISNNICNALSGLPISLNKDMMFDFIYVNDFCVFLHSIVDRIPFNSVSYNFCSGNPLSLVNLANIIKDQTGVNDEIIIKNEGMNPEYSGDPSKLFKEIGEFKFTPFNESIKNLIQFYKENLTAKDIEAFRKKAS